MGIQTDDMNEYDTSYCSKGSVSRVYYGRKHSNFEYFLEKYSKIEYFLKKHSNF